MARKGIDESCVAFVLCEVSLVVTKKDLAKGGIKFIMHSKLSYGKCSREARRVVEGYLEAVDGIEDGAVCPVEGEVARADVAGGGLGGGGAIGGEWCEVGDGGSV